MGNGTGIGELDFLDRTSTAHEILSDDSNSISISASDLMFYDDILQVFEMFWSRSLQKSVRNGQSQ